MLLVMLILRLRLSLFLPKCTSTGRERMARTVHNNGRAAGKFALGPRDVESTVRLVIPQFGVVIGCMYNYSYLTHNL